MPLLRALENVGDVCTENLSPDVMVMEPAKDGARYDASGPLNRARDRRIFIQCPVRSDIVVIACVGSQNPTQMPSPKTTMWSNDGLIQSTV